MVERNTTITCPHCSGQSKQEVPIDSCVLCSYGDMKYPPIQQGERC